MRGFHFRFSLDLVVKAPAGNQKKFHKVMFFSAKRRTEGMREQRAVKIGSSKL
jgi:hypothetical protein